MKGEAKNKRNGNRREKGRLNLNLDSKSSMHPLRLYRFPRLSFSNRVRELCIKTRAFPLKSKCLLVLLLLRCLLLLNQNRTLSPSTSTSFPSTTISSSSSSSSSSSVSIDKTGNRSPCSIDFVWCLLFFGGEIISVACRHFVQAIMNE